MNLTLDSRFMQSPDVELIRAEKIPRMNDQERMSREELLPGIRYLADPGQRRAFGIDQSKRATRGEPSHILANQPRMGMSPEALTGKGGMMITEQDVPDGEILDGTSGEEWHGYQKFTGSSIALAIHWPEKPWRPDFSVGKQESFHAASGENTGRKQQERGWSSSNIA